MGEPPRTRRRRGCFRWVLNRWSAASPQPIVLLLDEVDSLRDESLLTVLHQLRTGYERRPARFPWSIALCGLHHPKNYAISRSEALNIVAESVPLRPFSDAEVRALLERHTAETEQRFTPDAIEEVRDSTLGQPWLVNAMADAACFHDPKGRDWNREITRDAIVAARERWLASRPGHFEPITGRLREERVRRSLEPLLAGSRQWPPFDEDDLLYLRDTGLVAPAPPPRIANPIDREVIAQSLTCSAG